MSNNISGSSVGKSAFIVFLIVGTFTAALAAVVAWYLTETQAGTDRSQQVASRMSDEDLRRYERDIPVELLLQTQQALLLIDTEITRGQSPALKTLAGEMKQARASDLVRLKALLAERRQSYKELNEYTKSDYPAYDGMATLVQLNELKTVEAMAVDGVFLRLINTNVDGMIRSSGAYVQVAPDGELKDLANALKDERLAERGLLSQHDGMHDANGSHH